VEQGILRPVESAIRGVAGIREITSTAREGFGSIRIELVTGTDRMRAFQDIDQAVARIRTFPDDTEEPEVTLLTPRQEVMQVVLYGPVDIWTLRSLAENLRDRLISDPAITQVELGNSPKYVTHVEIPQHRVREYGLTLGQVADLIRQSSEDIRPAHRNERRRGAAAPQREAPMGRRIRGSRLSRRAAAAVTLSEIATITDGFVKPVFLRNSTSSRGPGENLPGRQAIAAGNRRVSAIMADVETTLPPGCCGGSAATSAQSTSSAFRCW
jgi:multidrug efflux pump subunit AcrB